jgi:hypothetical protein
MLLVVREGELPRILKINLNQRKHHGDHSDNDDKGDKRQISGSDFFFALRAAPPTVNLTSRRPPLTVR